ncbi:hypothetical protein VTL71DRAFT_2408 [Oculimacula yallundae]|uniref:Uncharacterized protein n=1 Tax=Oculimacula yallundae TaxID=86028 RepID=A0ABR4C8S8_9HELO
MSSFRALAQGGRREAYLSRNAPGTGDDVHPETIINAGYDDVPEPPERDLDIGK